MFHRRDDVRWVVALPDDAWWRLLEGLLTGASPQVALHTRAEALYALEMLAVWVAAEELEPEFLRLDPDIADHHSAFVALQREVARYVKSIGPGSPTTLRSSTTISISACCSSSAARRSSVCANAR